MRDRRVLGIGAAAAAGAAVAAAAWALAPDSSSASKKAGSAPATARVERRDLVVRESLDGQLGYADERMLATARPGTVTGLAREASVVGRGGKLYALDGRWTRLLYGSVPA